MTVCKVKPKKLRLCPCPPKHKPKPVIRCRKIVRKRKKKPGISLLSLIRQLQQRVDQVALDLRTRIDQQSAGYSQLTAGYSQLTSGYSQLTAITNQLRSDVNSIQAIISAPPITQSLRDALNSRISTAIIIETDAGTITGTLTEVGNDYVAITEPSGAIVLIPVAEINSFV
ncbi:DUF2642 domain-containing protein [Paenibacillus humicola]|uniref:DUF2642 domain-containing protein n=1 Tax=Paenibacillus humicola TaxID=3110540 RepID=UPI00237BA4ED|nr:DUF2642 domain-containing protein [Paenibacillus humicola]